MHTFAAIDGKLSPACEIVIPVSASGLLYGKGIFTSIALIGGEPFLWSKHWKRLTENAAAISLDITDITESQVLDNLRETIAANNVVNGRARITFFDTSSGPVWPGENNGRTAFFIITGEQQNRREQLRATISGRTLNSRSPLAGIKSCNYLDNILAMDEARSRGYDEAIRLNERGEVVSGSMSNVFWLTDGTLFTPALDSGCLAGTTRELVLEELECTEAIAAPGDLQNADAVFMTPAGIGIRRVDELDGRVFGRVSHPILNLWPA
jgi:branched-subunit amino acid aminotransferase/4-amino-4-deoxychorismate lyase